MASPSKLTRRSIAVVAASRRAPTLFLLSFAAIVLIPTWLVLPDDDEGLLKEIPATIFQARELFSGRYPFWDPWVAFGTPLPLSQTLVFHPFVVLAKLLPVDIAIGALYQLQLWVAVLCVWAVARQLGIRRWISALCVITYALSSPTIMLLRNFWPVVYVQWTLAPVLLLLLLKLLESEERKARAAYSLGAGLCTALMLLDGHAGVLPDLAIGFIAFLAAHFRRLPALWPWLAAGIGVFALAGASRLYDIALENTRSVVPHHQQVLGMDFVRLFLYPAHSLSSDPPRTLAIGGPFVLLVVLGFVNRRLAHRHVNGLRAATAAALVLWFVPVSAIPARSANYFAGEPLTLFAVFLAALALESLWRERRAWRTALAVGASVQVAVLIAGFVPLYSATLTRAIDYLQGEHVRSLRAAVKNQPVYAFFQRQPDHRDTRVYMAPGADDRLFSENRDYEFPGWSLHGLRLVNGEFKGIEMPEFMSPVKKLKTAIRGNASVSRSLLTLSVLNVGYVLATPEDPVAAGLEPTRAFHVTDPDATIVAYRNPARWPDAVVLRTNVKEIGLLPRRADCAEPGLLCADFAPVERLRVREAVRSQGWTGTTLHVRLAAASSPRVLMLSQLYRPGWRAELSDGRNVSGYRLLGGFTAFDLPPGAASARISYHPTARIALTALTWITLLGATIALVALVLVGRYRTRARQAT